MTLLHDHTRRVMLYHSKDIEDWLWKRLYNDGHLKDLELRHYRDKPLITEIWQHGVLAARFEIKLTLEKADETTSERPQALSSK